MFGCLDVRNQEEKMNNLCKGKRFATPRFCGI